jgi:hypothetical protein
MAAEIPMKSARYLYVIIFSLAATVYVAAQAAPSSAKALEQTAIANENDMIAARTKGDEAFFKRTLSADFAMVGIDGRLITGEEAADSVDDSSLADFLAYDMKVVPLGDHGAVVTYDAVVRVPDAEDQGPPPRYQHFSSVWIKENGSWKLSFQQTTAAHWGDW